MNCGVSSFHLNPAFACAARRTKADWQVCAHQCIRILTIAVVAVDDRLRQQTRCAVTQQCGPWHITQLQHHGDTPHATNAVKASAQHNATMPQAHARALGDHQRAPAQAHELHHALDWAYGQNN
jgi:hypothetical protein